MTAPARAELVRVSEKAHKSAAREGAQPSVGVATKLLTGFWKVGDAPILSCLYSFLTSPLSNQQHVKSL